MYTTDMYIVNNAIFLRTIVSGTKLALQKRSLEIKKVYLLINSFFFLVFIYAETLSFLLRNKKKEIK